ncbi:MAG: hypothetical protein ACREGR_02155 [Minisyncoccia bacterium]
MCDSLWFKIGERFAVLYGRQFGNYGYFSFADYPCQFNGYFVGHGFNLYATSQAHTRANSEGCVKVTWLRRAKPGRVLNVAFFSS